MANIIVGQIISIGQPLTITAKSSGTTFTKRSIVLALKRFDPNTGEPFSDRENTPELTFIGERVSDLDHFQVGQDVKVSFDISGRKYIDQSGVEKIITDIRPYKIEAYSARQSYQAPVQPQQPVTQPQAPTYQAPAQTVQPQAQQPQQPQQPPYNGGGYNPLF